MECRTCNHLNGAMSTKCLNCGATLIFEAAGHSEAYRHAARRIDSRIATGVGGLFGFFGVALIVKFVITGHDLSDRETHLASLAGGAAGALLARLYLRMNSDV